MIRIMYIHIDGDWLIVIGIAGCSVQETRGRMLCARTVPGGGAVECGGHVARGESPEGTAHGLVAVLTG